MKIEELKTLKTGTKINGIFAVSKFEFKPFKQKEGLFLQCDLSDRTGTIKGLVWDNAEKLKDFIKNKIVVSIQGEITRYNDTPQIVIVKIKEETVYDLCDMVPSLTKEVIKLYLMNMQAVTIKNETCKKIWDRALSEKKFMECPGGVGSVHHNYVGGLIEHSSSMVNIACNFVKSSPLNIDKDILLTGCLIHDIGKINSYNWSIVIEMGDVGRLLHHTSIGLEILNKWAEELHINPDDMDLLKLKHIIISHHENEGHRKPMFPEALMVSQIDAMDAMVQHSVMFIDNPENRPDKDSNWTKFCSLTNRQYFIPDMFKSEDNLPQEKQIKTNESEGIY